MQICDVLVAVVVPLQGNLRFDDGNVSDLIGWMKKNNRAARAARFLMFFSRSLPNDDVKFSYLRLWRQRELAAVNLSLFAFTWKPFVPSKRKCNSPILYNVNNMDNRKRLNLTQSSILMWRFRRSCRRSFLNSLQAERFEWDKNDFLHYIWKLKGTRDETRASSHKHESCFLIVGLFF